MINNFKDQTTSDIYDGLNTKFARKIPETFWGIAQRKLDMLNAAQDIHDLKSPPGNKLELLKGNLKGFYCIRINNQYRVIFQFSKNNASQVQIIDYHK